MTTRMKTLHSLHAIDNYTFGTKEARPEKDATPSHRMARLTDKYKTDGTRRTVEGVLLLQNHQHPHVLLLQQGTRENPVFRLPGGRLRPGEGDIEGAKRKMSSKLAPREQQLSATHQAKWMVEEQLAVWWRPNFETLMYPYLPAHVTKPKECKKIFMVRLAEKMVFAVPKNFKLLAVPLWDLHGNAARYGPVIASIPHLISRYDFDIVTPIVQQPAPTPPPKAAAAPAAVAPAAAPAAAGQPAADERKRPRDDDGTADSAVKVERVE